MENRMRLRLHDISHTSIIISSVIIKHLESSSGESTGPDLIALAGACCRTHVGDDYSINISRSFAPPFSYQLRK